jgi:hypothetical protein
MRGLEVGVETGLAAAGVELSSSLVVGLPVGNGVAGAGVPEGMLSVTWFPTQSVDPAMVAWMPGTSWVYGTMVTPGVRVKNWVAVGRGEIERLTQEAIKPETKPVIARQHDRREPRRKLW